MVISPCTYTNPEIASVGLTPVRWPRRGEAVHCSPTQVEVFQRIALAYGK